MKMQNNKVVLPLIIFLLLVFLPCSVYGIYYQVMVSNEQGNPNHEHKHDNKLYYYDKQDKLIGIYNCQNHNCNDAITIIDDEYLNHFEGDVTNLGIFANDYTFIQDGDVVKLHNLKSNISIASFYRIKNYGTNIAGNSVIIVGSNGLYGLFNLDNIVFEIPTNYLFMGISDSYYKNGELSKDKIAVLKDNDWYIINSSEEILSVANPNPIYNYDDNYIYHVTADNEFLIYDYEGKSIVPSLTIEKIDDYENYHVVLNDDGEVLVYDESYENIIEEYSDYSTKFSFEVTEDCVNILNGNKVVEIFK